ncbi:hypothetical protein OH764_19330 [Burkholderia sp. M6-3]
MAGKAVVRTAGGKNGDVAAGTAELQDGGEAGKAAADDDDDIPVPCVGFRLSRLSGSPILS